MNDWEDAGYARIMSRAPIGRDRVFGKLGSGITDDRRRRRRCPADCFGGAELWWWEAERVGVGSPSQDHHWTFDSNNNNNNITHCFYHIMKDVHLQHLRRLIHTRMSLLITLDSLYFVDSFLVLMCTNTHPLCICTQLTRPFHELRYSLNFIHLRSTETSALQRWKHV